ncbi:MAG TPA: hypothetical protein VIH67_02955 [Candidatus Acidoferrum sp.]
MLLATIILLSAIPQSGELARSLANAPVEVSAEASKDVVGARSLPSMPTPKAKIIAEVDGVSSNVTASVAGAEAVQPPRVALAIQPVKQAYTRPRETREQRFAWYTLTVTGHGAAAFDAYSTRRALSGNYGTEGNPLLRPFAHSNALYVATQVSPAVMDLLGKRMMVSENRWVRRMWWLPQVAGSGFSIGAGVHNMGVVK